MMLHASRDPENAWSHARVVEPAVERFITLLLAKARCTRPTRPGDPRSTSERDLLARVSAIRVAHARSGQSEIGPCPARQLCAPFRPSKPPRRFPNSCRPALVAATSKTGSLGTVWFRVKTVRKPTFARRVGGKSPLARRPIQRQPARRRACALCVDLSKLGDDVHKGPLVVESQVAHIV